MVKTGLPTNDALDLLHADMAAANMAPTWKYVSDFVAVEPRVSYRPWLWRWDDVIPLLMRAGNLITPEQGGERRSMEHVNPDLKPFFSTSHTIATAFQLVRAGEKAPAHRHAASAIRFAARSEGGAVYTKVQGERLYMEENDLVLTPAWTWHEHANNTADDIVWLDALDFPLVNLLQASVFERPSDDGPDDREDDFSAGRLGFYRPVEWGAYSEPHPIVRYPWTDMRAALERLRGEEGSPYSGIVLEYVNPVTSGSTLPNLSCRAQLLRAGKRFRARRAISSTVYFVIAGAGTTVMDSVAFEWGRGDVFVVPNWCWHEHMAGGDDCFLLAITDEPLMRRMGLYREEDYPGDGHQEVAGAFAS